MKRITIALVIALLVTPLIFVQAKKRKKPTTQEVALQMAILQNNESQIVSLLDAGVDVNAVAVSGENMVAVATNAGYVNIVKLLLKKGANPNVVDKPALFYAKKADVAKALIDGGANINIVSQGTTPFIHWIDLFATLPTQAEINQTLSVARQQNLGDAAIKLIESSFVTRKDLQNMVNTYKSAGYDFDAQLTSDKVNALLEAAVMSNYPLVEMLINAGVNVNLQNCSGQTALNILSGHKKGSQAGFDKIADLLHQKGADFNLQDYDKVTPLFYATQEGQLGRCKTLVKYGADVNIPAMNNHTPLFVAGTLDIAKFLVTSGAKVDVVSDYGATPLFSAVDANLVSYFLSKGMDVNHKDKDGNNTLITDCVYVHNAYIQGDDIQDQYVPKIKLLISKGIDVNFKGKKGTALQIAQRDPLEKIVKVLVAAGAK